MSVRALTWSFNLRLADMAAKAVLHALADHADENGRCWPSTRRIALWAGCNEKTARKALHRVEALGAIQREGRTGLSDVFILQFEWTPTKIDPSQIRDLPKATVTPSLKRPGTPPNNDLDPSLFREPNHQEPSKNRQSTPRGDDDKSERLPGTWRLSEAGRAHAADCGLDPDNAAESFTDYFVEGRGKREKRTPAGWEKRWRIWCNRDAARPMGRPAARTVQAPRGNDAFYEQLADIAAKSRGN